MTSQTRSRAWLFLAVTCLALAAAPCGFAQALDKATPEQMIETRLSQADPNMPIESIVPSGAPGLYEVTLGGGLVLYTTATGDFFVLGDLFAVRQGGLANLSENKRRAQRVELLAGVPEEEMIVFEPEGEVRATVSVFTDVDCFYCQKFHSEVPTLNDMGIRVRYLAWPRDGVGGAAYRKIASAWCSDDRQAALTRLKNKRSIPDNVCPGNPVAEQMILGEKAGVQGTPALVFENGQLLGGYVPAPQLAARLGLD